MQEKRGSIPLRRPHARARTGYWTLDGIQSPPPVTSSPLSLAFGPPKRLDPARLDVSPCSFDWTPAPRASESNCASRAIVAPAALRHATSVAASTELHAALLSTKRRCLTRVAPPGLSVAHASRSVRMGLPSVSTAASAAPSLRPFCAASPHARCASRALDAPTALRGALCCSRPAIIIALPAPSAAGDTDGNVATEHGSKRHFSDSCSTILLQRVRGAAVVAGC
jgi:hypothetical protein